MDWTQNMRRETLKGGVWGESELAKTVRSHSLAPGFVNNECIASEITQSTAHVCREVLARPLGTLRGVPV